MEVNEHFERLSLTYPYPGLGVQDDFCIQLSCLEIRILEVAPRLWPLQGAMGGENKDLHDAIFAPIATQGRNSGAAAVDCGFPNSFLGDCRKKTYRYFI
uniref:Uncharacterized protein n=1 Tax=Candidatus Kentrum sp. FM TaxID=2126340 RepID=A0A450TMA6_9GAMM|nr:MAG: hypothetical protein BECKFM1743C_GA0114222_105023 [Candidatus Kentron sp. FM]